MSSLQEASEQFLVTEEVIGYLQHLSLDKPTRSAEWLTRFTGRPIIWDSRKLGEIDLPSNQKCLFVARRRHAFDAHALVEAILENDHLVVANPEFLKTFVTPERWSTVTAHQNLIFTSDIETTLAEILQKSAGICSDTFLSLAVTGTNGKTSVVQIIESLLPALRKQPTLRMGTLGIAIGSEQFESPYPTMPDVPGFYSALKLATNRSIQTLIFEATSHGLVENRMGNWQVDVAAFTNLTQDHLDFHKTMAAYLEAKSILFKKHLKPQGWIVLNANDPCWSELAHSAAAATKNLLLFFEGVHQPNIDTLQAKYAKIELLRWQASTTNIEGISGTLFLTKKEQVVQQANYHLSLPGRFQHENFATAVGMLLTAGYPLLEIVDTAKKTVGGIPGRLQLIKPSQEKPGLPCVVVDYAHTPDALKKTLETARELTPSAGKLICVFGCGGDRDPSKRKPMGAIASNLADLCFVTSDNPRTESPDQIVDDILAGIDSKREIRRVVERRAAIHQAIQLASGNDIVVIAGKGHENYQIIGKEKFHFSDVEVATEALNQKTLTKD